MRGVLYVGTNWDTKDAEVVCRMLGYPGVQQHKTTNFSPVKGISWLILISIVLVQKRQLVTAVVLMHGDNGCWHSLDVGVTCKMGKLCVQ